MTERDDTRARPRRRGGFSFMEVILVLTLMGIMTAMAVPSFQRAVEKAKADIAVANLRAVWAAERFYWLDNRSYAGGLAALLALDLIDPELTASGGPYVYTLSASADGQSFAATATRAAGSRWQGSFVIDQTGAVTGSIAADGEPTIVPAAQ